MQTKGHGVNLALNSLADDKLLATVRCIAPHGHLLEIGKYDILKQTGLSMRPLHYNISFQGVDLDNLFLSPKLDAVGNAVHPQVAGMAHCHIMVYMPVNSEASQCVRCFRDSERDFEGS